MTSDENIVIPAWMQPMYDTYHYAPAVIDGDHPPQRGELLVHPPPRQVGGGGPTVQEEDRRVVRGGELTDEDLAPTGHVDDATRRERRWDRRLGVSWFEPPGQTADPGGGRPPPGIPSGLGQAWIPRRPSTARQISSTTIAPTKEPIRPLGRSARPSPATRLASSPPTNDPGLS